MKEPAVKKGTIEVLFITITDEYRMVCGIVINSGIVSIGHCDVYGRYCVVILLSRQPDPEYQVYQ